MQMSKLLLEQQIDIYKKSLENKIQLHNYNLSHTEVLRVSQSLDLLIVRYLKLTKAAPNKNETACHQ
jgi:hypothetical protein